MLTEFTKEDMVGDAIRSLKSGNVQETFAIVHKLKALVEYINIPAADDMVHELTETLREGKVEGVEIGLNYLKEIFSGIKVVIIEEIENDKKKNESVFKKMRI